MFFKVYIYKKVTRDCAFIHRRFETRHTKKREKKRENSEIKRVSSQHITGVIVITRLESFRNNAARETTNKHFLSLLSLC